MTTQQANATKVIKKQHFVNSTLYAVKYTQLAYFIANKIKNDVAIFIKAECDWFEPRKKW